MKRDGMSRDEALEWIDFTVLGVKPNGAGFIMLYPFDRDLLEEAR